MPHKNVRGVRTSTHKRNKDKGKKDGVREKMFHEVFTNSPSTVDESKGPEEKRKQMIAIALNKTRRAKK